MNHLLHGRFGYDFPAGILVVNVLGCLAIGLLAGLIATTRIHVGEVGRHLLITGLLGGFTTFSSFGLDTFTLARGGHVQLAFLNVAGSLILGLGAVWRPGLSENVVITGGLTGLLPLPGFEDLFSSPCAAAGCESGAPTLYNAFVQIKLSY